MAIIESVHSPDAGSEQEALLRLLYAAPVGLARLNASGDFELANNEFARLSQIVFDDFATGNFFDLLKSLSPEFDARFQGSLAQAEQGFEDELIPLPEAMDGVEALACSLLRLNSGDFIVVLRDATRVFRRECELQSLQRA